MHIRSTMDTFDLLPSMGFVLDSSYRATINFGNFKMVAIRGLNLRFVDGVTFSGVYSTTRMIVDVHFEMPPTVQCREQCEAWIAWNLDKMSGYRFRSKFDFEWLDHGRKFAHLLPWEIERAKVALRAAKFAARPNCNVRRKWLRLGLNELAELFKDASEFTLVDIAFDGIMLRMTCLGETIQIPAHGNAWPSEYSISVQDLRPLPKRLRGDEVDFSFFQSELYIGSSTYGPAFRKR